jgi:GntR family transcriptional regulator / MocR family aminotransferase
VNAAGLSTGVAPPLRRALRLAKHLTDWHCPTAAQAALARFVDEGLLARHIRKMRTECNGRHERMLEVLAGQGDWLRPIESTVGMHLTALLPPAKHLSAEAVLTRTDGSGVAVNSLSEFYAGGATQCGLVLGYGAMALDKIWLRSATAPIPGGLRH